MSDLEQWSTKDLEALVGGLSNPSKMPGFGYSLPARECGVGSRLREVDGSTCQHCYAMKGRYLFPAVQAALYRRLDAINDPRWAAAMATLIVRKRQDWFRWHDSGDLQSVDHFDRIVQVCRMTPNVRHWLPTREYRIVQDWVAAGGEIPPNLNVRMSAHMIGGEVPTFKRLKVTVSTVSRTKVAGGAHQCPAPSQGNKCGDCRACWDRTVKLVNYALH